MISRIAVYGRDWWEQRIAKAHEMYVNAASPGQYAYDPAEAMRQKETIVINYLKNIWGIEFYDHDGEKGLVTMVQEALDRVLNEEYES